MKAFDFLSAVTELGISKRPNRRGEFRGFASFGRDLIAKITENQFIFIYEME